MKGEFYEKWQGGDINGCLESSCKFGHMIRHKINEQKIAHQSECQSFLISAGYPLSRGSGCSYHRAQPNKNKLNFKHGLLNK